MLEASEGRPLAAIWLAVAAKHAVISSFDDLNFLCVQVLSELPIANIVHSLHSLGTFDQWAVLDHTIAG